MQEIIKVESVSSIESKISINVPSNVVDSKFNEFFESIKNKATVPGFRQGKAPTSVLKQFLSEKAKPAVVNILLGEYYEMAIKDYNLNPVGSPNIKDFDASTSEYPGQFGFDGSYSVEFTVEVLPKLDIVGYNGLDISIPEVNEQELAVAKMNECREQFSDKKQILDRGAQIGDSVVIDFVGYLDNVPFEGGAGKDVPLAKLGSSNFIPGFEEQVVGMKPDENKKISVKFPENYHAAQFSGKDAIFDVTMHSIVEATPAEVNEDLALMSGFENLEEMQKAIQKVAEKEKTIILRQKLDETIISKILESNTFDCPQTLIAGEALNLKKHFKNADIPPELMEKINKNAEFNVKRALVLEAIYEKEKNVEITPEELNEALEEYAKMVNKTKDDLVSALYNSKQMDSFVGQLRATKVMDYIIKNAKKQESEAV